MARTRLTEEQIAGFKQELAQAATRLFVRDGYAGVTMRAIASELGCSPMKAYRYVGDKNEIFAMARTLAYRAFGDSQKEAYLSGENARERLRELGRAYFRYARENPLPYRLMFELLEPNPPGHPELEQAGIEAMKPLRTAVAELIDQGVLSGDADLLTNLFWSGVHGVVSLNLAGKLFPGSDTEALEEAMPFALMTGLVSRDDGSIADNRPCLAEQEGT